jgi:hypothetical protein
MCSAPTKGARGGAYEVAPDRLIRTQSEFFGRHCAG